MAGIRKKGDSYYCTFRFQGRRYYFAVGKMSEQQALARGVEVDETLGLIERGRLTVPEGVRFAVHVALMVLPPPRSMRHAPPPGSPPSPPSPPSPGSMEDTVQRPLSNR